MSLNVPLPAADGGTGGQGWASRPPLPLPGPHRTVAVLHVLMVVVALGVAVASLQWAAGAVVCLWAVGREVARRTRPVLPGTPR